MQLTRRLQNRRKRHDVEAPENCLQFPKIRFRQIRPCIRRPVIHPANFQRQRIRLRRHQQIRAQTTKFLRQPVSHIQRHAQRSCGHGHAHCQGRHAEYFAPGASSERVGYESQEHFRTCGSETLSYRGISSAAFVTDDTSNTTSSPSTSGGKSDRIASALLTDRRNIDRRSAVPADHVLSLLPVAIRAANQAGIQRSAIAVRFLDDHEANRLRHL